MNLECCDDLLLRLFINRCFCSRCNAHWMYSEFDCFIHVGPADSAWKWPNDSEIQMPRPDPKFLMHVERPPTTKIIYLLQVVRFHLPFESRGKCTRISKYRRIFHDSTCNKALTQLCILARRDNHPSIARWMENQRAICGSCDSFHSPQCTKAIRDQLMTVFEEGLGGSGRFPRLIDEPGLSFSSQPFQF